MSNEVKCNCQHCGERISFTSDRAGQTGECPHCKRETLLSIPPAKPSQIVRCPCQHCHKPIGFDASELAEENSIVPCPHCSQKTRLFIPPPKVRPEPTAQPAAAAPKTPKLPSQIVHCPCQHCRKPIGFDVSELTEENSLVPCPHCSQKTKLFVPPPPSQPSPAVVANKEAAAPEAGKTSAPAPKENGQRPVETTADGVLVRSKHDTLKLAGDKIIIQKQSWVNTLLAGENGERTFKVSSLLAMQVKPAGSLTLGCILLSFASSKVFMGGVEEATPESTGLLFTPELNDQIADFKTRVEKLMQAAKDAALASKAPALAEVKK